ncbi:hypothetical protein P3T29_000073 [Kitasatospora sp. MAP5-34]|nr:hypothetical protein [Kitasatospora sp. MAP5-34]
MTIREMITSDGRLRLDRTRKPGHQLLGPHLGGDSSAARENLEPQRGGEPVPAIRARGQMRLQAFERDTFVDAAAWFGCRLAVETGGHSGTVVGAVHAAMVSHRMAEPGGAGASRG